MEKRKPSSSTPLFFIEQSKWPIIQPTFTNNETNNTYFKNLNKKRDYFESLRLLYVACTRARERLNLSCQAATDVEFSQFNGYQSRFLRHAFHRGPHFFNGIWVGE